ncbi:FecR family protein [Larkinella insperata]|uniref:FecR family protein n=1 Tax=Larkinella insperata TaxID=332158 RepID=A0ABW3QLV2_9BACT|nr:FecR domain-containing protein [Larkinella insperata]
MKNNYPSPELLEKYLAGRCSPEEARQVERWYDSFENRQDLAQTHPETEESAHSERMLKQIQERIEAHESGLKSVRRLWPGKNWLWTLSGVAAAVIVLAVGVWQFQRPEQAEKPRFVAPLTSQLITLENKSKTILRHELADGSVVWLSPATKLRVPQRFALSVRSVQLEGEAFFEVRRDTTRPFVIQTGKLKTEVLGTTFNVRAYRNSPRFEVSVVTGKVAVSVADQKKILLTARQQAFFNPSAESLAKTGLPRSAKPKLWEPTTIAFEWASLRQVADALEETFGVRIVFRNPALRNCKLRADFTNMRLPAILNLLCKTTDMSYTLDGQQIALDGPGCF